MDVWHTDVHVLFKDDQERLLIRLPQGCGGGALC